MPRRKKDTVTLNAYDVKQLLQDAEKAGVPRALFPLKSYCEEKPHFYGAVGDPKRRAIQQQWNNCRRLTVEGYARFLQKYGVEPGPDTAKELEAAVKELEADAAENKLASETATETEATETEATVSIDDIPKDDEDPNVLKDLLMPSLTPESSPKEKKEAAASTPPRPTRTTGSDGMRSPMISRALLPTFALQSCRLSGLATKPLR
jgi:hypothetical protein